MAEKQNIFLVDDEPIQLEMLKDHLKSNYGAYQYHTFSTGEDCILNLDKNPVIVFLDYNLSNIKKDAINGVEVLKKIKKSHPDTEVVMLSGQDKIEVAVNSMRYGAFDYIVKGETAFSRAEKVVYNIYRYTKLKSSSAKYKKLTMIFAFAFLIMLFVIILLKITGYIVEFPTFNL